MDRVFLDANVLFSAAYRPQSPLRMLFSMEGVRLLSSHLAWREAEVNLLAHRPEALSVLEDLSDGVHLVGEADDSVILPEHGDLPEKDERILRAAVAAGSTHFLTGDRRHFGALYGPEISGVRVMAPAQYLAGR